MTRLVRPRPRHAASFASFAPSDSADGDADGLSGNPHQRDVVGVDPYDFPPISPHTTRASPVSITSPSLLTTANDPTPYPFHRSGPSLSNSGIPAICEGSTEEKGRSLWTRKPFKHLPVSLAERANWTRDRMIHLRHHARGSVGPDFAPDSCRSSMTEERPRNALSRHMDQYNLRGNQALRQLFAPSDSDSDDSGTFPMLADFYAAMRRRVAPSFIESSSDSDPEEVKKDIQQEQEEANKLKPEMLYETPCHSPVGPEVPLGASETEVLWEHQRGIVLKGVPHMSPSALIAGDPGAWVSGRTGRPTAWTVTEANYLPPPGGPGWAWAWPSWAVDMRGSTDDAGWQYSGDFGDKYGRALHRLAALFTLPHDESSAVATAEHVTSSPASVSSSLGFGATDLDDPVHTAPSSRSRAGATPTPGEAAVPAGGQTEHVHRDLPDKFKFGSQPKLKGQKVSKDVGVMHYLVARVVKPNARAHEHTLKEREKERKRQARREAKADHGLEALRRSAAAVAQKAKWSARPMPLSFVRRRKWVRVQHKVLLDRTLVPLLLSGQDVGVYSFPQAFYTPDPHLLQSQLAKDHDAQRSTSPMDSQPHPRTTRSRLLSESSDLNGLLQELGISYNSSEENVGDTRASPPSPRSGHEDQERGQPFTPSHGAHEKLQLLQERIQSELIDLLAHLLPTIFTPGAAWADMRAWMQRSLPPSAQQKFSFDPTTDLSACSTHEIILLGLLNMNPFLPWNLVRMRIFHPDLSHAASELRHLLEKAGAIFARYQGSIAHSKADTEVASVQMMGWALLHRAHVEINFIRVQQVLRKCIVDRQRLDFWTHWMGLNHQSSSQRNREGIECDHDMLPWEEDDMFTDNHYSFSTTSFSGPVRSHRRVHRPHAQDVADLLEAHLNTLSSSFEFEHGRAQFLSAVIHFAQNLPAHQARALQRKQYPSHERHYRSRDKGRSSWVSSTVVSDGQEGVPEPFVMDGFLTTELSLTAAVHNLIHGPAAMPPLTSSSDPSEAHSKSTTLHFANDLNRISVELSMVARMNYPEWHDTWKETSPSFPDCSPSLHPASTAAAILPGQSSVEQPETEMQAQRPQPIQHVSRPRSHTCSRALCNFPATPPPRLLAPTEKGGSLSCTPMPTGSYKLAPASSSKPVYSDKSKGIIPERQTGPDRNPVSPTLCDEGLQRESVSPQQHSYDQSEVQPDTGNNHEGFHPFDPKVERSTPTPAPISGTMSRSLSPSGLSTSDKAAYENSPSVPPYLSQEELLRAPGWRNCSTNPSTSMLEEMSSRFLGTHPL